MTSIPGLRALARLHGIQTAYHDASGKRQEASTESLTAVLKAFGASVESAADVPRALRERRLVLWQRAVPAVTVSRPDEPGSLELRLPAADGSRRVEGEVALEGGGTVAVGWDLRELAPSLAEEVEGRRFALFRLRLPHGLPLGYHRLSLDVPSRPASTLLAVAPLRCPSPPMRTWGVFLPLYALRNAYDWGAGNYSRLAALARWIGELGGGVVGTLPLLPTFLEEPLEPSPYAPISRLALNPFYIDLARAPGMEASADAQALCGDRLDAEVRLLRGSPEVDYARGMALKRRVLETLSAAPENAAPLGGFASENPTAEAFAQFMAARERLGPSWRKWPDRQRCGRLTPADYAEDARRYHLYGQMAASAQMGTLGRAQDVAGLYLDYPVGVHPDGFDVWREQERFVLNVTVGAPPDAFFTKGQNWSFNPLHPERAADGRYFAEALRHHLRYASLLRIDHVMGLHRQWWVPKGAAPTDGAYVCYPSEASYAILAIEAHRYAAGIVGEDLGTVPSSVPRAMARHGLMRMFVLQFEARPDGPRAVPPVPRGSVASLNTHDTPTFAGFWNGLDIDDRYDLGLLDEREARRARAERNRVRGALADWLRRHGHLRADSADGGMVVQAAYRGLAASNAGLVLVNLEDLWLEPQPQNMPGTSEERPNWRRKARYTMEEITSTAAYRELLAELAQLRRGHMDER